MLLSEESRAVVVFFGQAASLRSSSPVPSGFIMLHPFKPLTYTPEALQRYGEPTRLSSDRSQQDGNPIAVRALHAVDTPGSYRRGEYRCRALLNRGFMQEGDTAFVSYTIGRPDRPELTGLVGLLDLDAARVYPHEGVMASSVATRRADIERAGAYLEPVIVAGSLADVPSLPDAVVLRQVRYDEEVHTIRSIPTLPDSVLAADFVVLDGHHRIAAAKQHSERTEATPSILAMVVEDQSPGLFVEPQHRVLAGHEMSLDALPVEAVVMPYRRGDPVSPGAVAIVSDDSCVVITLDRGVENDVRRRISSLTLEYDILGPLGMWVEGYATREADAYAELSAGARAVAIMGDIAIEDVVSIARRGVVMPEKTTCFNPKVAVGLVGAALDDACPG